MTARRFQFTPLTDEQIALVEQWVADQSKPSNGAKWVAMVDVSTIFEYGLEQKLSNSIRCF